MKIEDAASSDEATFPTGPDAEVDDPEAEEKYRKGFGDGIVWATDYATEDELRDLVEKFERGGQGDSDMDHSLMRDNKDIDIVDNKDIDTYRDDPYWQGFLTGAEEVLRTR